MRRFVIVLVRWVGGDLIQEVNHMKASNMYREKINEHKI